MRDECSPDLCFFLDVLHTLEALSVPYMIIGAFAGIVYGMTRVTYDIDMVVSLSDQHIDALATAYPSPRYRADPIQMRESVAKGMMFNIIDAERGEKADLIPLTPSSSYRSAFAHRVRQPVETPGGVTFDVWCARPEDVILGKLMAWAEGRSRKHEMDIHQMMVFSYSDLNPSQGVDFDEKYIDVHAAALGADVLDLWKTTKRDARREGALSSRYPHPPAGRP